MENKTKQNKLNILGINLLYIISESLRMVGRGTWPTDLEMTSSSLSLTSLRLNSPEIFIFWSFADDTMEGEALVVRCPHSVLSAKVTWHHTGTRKRIPEEEEGSRVFSKGIFLWFLPTSLEDSGNYTCVIN